MICTLVFENDAYFLFSFIQMQNIEEDSTSVAAME